MHKSIALIGLLLFANSVLAPTSANAQMVPVSLIPSTISTTTSMTTTPISSVQEPQQAPETLSVTLTSYNAVAAQTSPTPWITASGATSNSQVIAARSRDLANELPYGTIIAIDGSDSSGTYCGYNSVQHLIGYRVIADSMAARMHDKVDVMLNQNDTVPLGGREINPAVALGACTGVSVQVVGYVNPSEIPSTQAALADLVQNSSHFASKTF
jgi:3D (Asp-Asp-Asp) domain-containing protein